MIINPVSVVEADGLATHEPLAQAHQLAAFASGHIPKMILACHTESLGQTRVIYFDIVLVHKTSKP